MKYGRSPLRRFEIDRILSDPIARFTASYPERKEIERELMLWRKWKK
jgi:hypothetical protein